MPFISRISQAKQNREIEGCKYQLQAKIAQNYYSISNCMALNRQNEGAKIIFGCEVVNFYSSQIKGFYSIQNVNSNYQNTTGTYKLSLVIKKGNF